MIYKILINAIFVSTHLAVKVAINATFTSSNGVNTLQAYGASSDFQLPNLQAITFKQFTLNASMTVQNGKPEIKFLSFSGGVQNTPFGSASGFFSYKNSSTTIFSLSSTPSLPKPFMQASKLILDFIYKGLHSNTSGSKYS